VRTLSSAFGNIFGITLWSICQAILEKYFRAHACGPRGTDRLNSTPPPI